MKLSELLDELRTNILNDRSDRVAGTSDYLWSDATLVRYIAEAERRFARKGLVIRDARTAEVCQVTLVEGQTDYDLHPSVLAVLSAKMTGDNADMARAGHTSFDTYRAPDTHFFDPSQVSALTPGKPIAYSTDQEFAGDDVDSSGIVVMRVYPEPTAEYDGTIINLRVIRLPINPLQTSRMAVAPEIPEDHHLEMLDWAAYLALRISDHDAGDAKRAMEFRQSFEAHVLEARNSVLRKMFVPTKWGFGRNGFSWEH